MILGSTEFNEIARRYIVYDFKGKQQHFKFNMVFDREPVQIIS